MTSLGSNQHLWGERERERERWGVGDDVLSYVCMLCIYIYYICVYRKRNVYSMYIYIYIIICICVAGHWNHICTDAYLQPPRISTQKSPTWTWWSQINSIWHVPFQKDLFRSTTQRKKNPILTPPGRFETNYHQSTGGRISSMKSSA